MRNKLAILLIAAIILSALSGLVLAQPQGPWVDEVVFFSEPNYDKAIDMLSKGDMHVYFSDIRGDPKLIERMRSDPTLAINYSYGLYFELTFNPVGPEFPATGKLNPFSNPRIREAMNWLIDRDYIVNEIMFGLARPKILPLISEFADYKRLGDFAKQLEQQYRYDFDKAKRVITEEMLKMGAELKDGKWYYKGEPVTIIFLIRQEDQRKQIGHYVADQLEKIGFKVERREGASRDLAPIWRGNPADGKWHIYTGGWITTAVERDSASNFGAFYTPLWGAMGPLWQAYKPDPEFFEVARRLWNGEFSTFEERQQLMRKAAELALKDSVRVWLVDQIVPWVRRKEVSIACDLAGGFNNYMWPLTLRFLDREGGTIRAGAREVLVEPWNPVAPTNWVYDVTIMHGVDGYLYRYDPITGLPVPMYFDRIELFLEKGVPATANTEWLKLTFVDKVEVPSDAWWGYDIEKGKVITAGEAGVKAAKAKVVIHYKDVLGKVMYHDGSVMSMADFLFVWPLTFAQVNEKSPLYDESAVPSFNAWRAVFAGFKIVSENPLIIEYYHNYTAIDAEFIALYWALWPTYPWHVYAIGVRAEEKGLLAFSSDKADKLKVEWMNYIGGPSLEILAKMLNESIKEGYIPFKEFMGKYVSSDEARKRYEALYKWYKQYGHFFISCGPFYLERADYNAHQAVLKAFRPTPPAQAGITNYLTIFIALLALIIVIAIVVVIRRRKQVKTTNLSEQKQ